MNLNTIETKLNKNELPRDDVRKLLEYAFGLKEENQKIETLREHNDILFNFIKKFINEFESIPLFKDGTHRLIVSGKLIEKVKQEFINKGYEF